MLPEVVKGIARWIRSMLNICWSLLQKRTIPLCEIFFLSSLLHSNHSNAATRQFRNHSCLLAGRPLHFLRSQIPSTSLLNLPVHFNHTSFWLTCVSGISHPSPPKINPHHVHNKPHTLLLPQIYRSVSRSHRVRLTRQGSESSPTSASSLKRLKSFTED